MSFPRRDKNVSRRVREFLTPPPKVALLKNREMQTVLGLFGLLAGLAVFFAMFSDKTPNVLKKIFPEKKTTAQSRPLTPAEQEVAEAAQSRKVTLRELFAEAAGDVKDGDDFVESAGYSRLVRELAVVPPDELTQAVEGILDPKEVAKDPKAHRGRVYRVRGHVVFLKTERVWRSGEVQEIYRGCLFDGAQRFMFDAVQHPGWPIQLRKEVVDIEGVFYRLVRYDQQDDRRSPALPYLLVRNIRRTPLPHSEGQGPLALASYLGVLALVTTAMVIYMIRRRPSRPAGAPITPVGFHQMFQNKLREERRKESGH